MTKTNAPSKYTYGLDKSEINRMKNVLVQKAKYAGANGNFENQDCTGFNVEDMKILRGENVYIGTQLY